MATSISTISRRLFRSVALPKLTTSRNLYMPFSTSSFSDLGDSPPQFDSDSPPSSPQVSQNSSQQRSWDDQLLENGVDTGIFRAILLGQVGQPPLEKTFLRSGRRYVLFTLGTGGMRNHRMPLVNEDPKEYANRCNVQWHRVCIYHENMVDMAMKNIIPGSIVYLEGNLQTRVFTDAATGLARRIREIGIHRDGRILFLGKDGGIVFLGKDGECTHQRHN